jgi:hypothetical protein
MTGGLGWGRAMACPHGSITARLGNRRRSLVASSGKLRSAQQRSTEVTARWTRILISLVALVAMLAPGAALGARKKKPKPAPPPVSDLPNYVSHLAWQLRGKHLDESGEITGEIQKAVLNHMQEWLAADPSRAESVTARRELERIFYNLRYPTEAKPACFDEPWQGATLLGVGYTLYWTNYNRVNVLALFEKRAGKVRLAAVTDFIPMVDLAYEFHPPVGSEDFWFFARGTRPGKSQQRLSTILYAFDGERLKPLWEKRDIYDGRMDIGESKVVIRYLKEDEYVREQAHNRKPPRHEATYLITANGLELESDREVPF